MRGPIKAHVVHGTVMMNINNGTIVSCGYRVWGIGCWVEVGVVC